MNYQKVYDNLINRAINRHIDGYVELHHVVPRCMGGVDLQSNIVALTPEEHFLAHVLLVKMHPEHHGLILAVQYMMQGSVKNQRNTRKLYGWLKRRFSVAMQTLQSGECNSQFGSRWIHNPATLESIKIRQGVMIPEGWDAGRKPKPVQKPSRVYENVFDDEYASALLNDYEAGLPMPELLIKYGKKSEQSVTSFINRRFPNRKRFKPSQRVA